jgi:hypothetical protein
MKASTEHPEMRVKHCAYGHSVGTLLNPRGVTSFPQEQLHSCKTAATVVEAVPSTVHYPANYKKNKYTTSDKIKKNVNKLFTLTI